MDGSHTLLNMQSHVTLTPFAVVLRRYAQCGGYRTGPEAFHVLLNNFGHQLALPPQWLGPALNMEDFD